MFRAVRPFWVVAVWLGWATWHPRIKNGVRRGAAQWMTDIDVDRIRGRTTEKSHSDGKAVYTG